MGLASNEGLGVDVSFALNMRFGGTQATTGLTVPQTMPIVPATSGGWMCRNAPAPRAAPVLLKPGVRTEGIADNELIARRSTAARSANHKHFFAPDLASLGLDES